METKPANKEIEEEDTEELIWCDSCASEHKRIV
jgi:hypothetical protein